MILDDIVAKKKIRLKNTPPLDELKARCAEKKRTPISFYNALMADGMSIIAEVKRSSPSKGLIRADFDHMAIATAYTHSNIQAMSILTEEDFFGGSPRFLADIREIANIPLLRKDFIICPEQIYEAYLLGADAVLLIAALLDDETFKSFYDIAKGLGMDCLCETHDAEELKRVVNIGADIIGINNRNLHTFEEDITTTERLIKDVPKSAAVVSESSIKNAHDLKYLADLGADAVLIGETFMRSDNIERAVEDMRSEV